MSLSAPVAAVESYMRIMEKKINSMRKQGGMVRLMASERYPLLSTASPLFLCFVFGVPLSFSSNHYVNAMRRIMRDNKVERIYDYTCNPYIVMAFQTIHFR